MEIVFKDHQYGDSTINFTISLNQINGILTNAPTEIEDIIKSNINCKGQLIINEKSATKKEYAFYKKNIIVIKDKLTYSSETLYEYIEKVMKIHKIYPKDKDKKIKDSLKIVGVNIRTLKSSIHNLSSSEKKLVSIAIGLIINPNILIIENATKSLDLKNKKKVIMLFRKLVEQYNKTIVLISENSDELYQYTKHIIIFKKHKIIIDGDTDYVFKKVSFLKEHNINIPKIIDFTYRVKKEKKAKLEYHKDIRDIIKDIYKHV